MTATMIKPATITLKVGEVTSVFMLAVPGYMTAGWLADIIEAAVKAHNEAKCGDRRAE